MGENRKDVPRVLLEEIFRNLSRECVDCSRDVIFILPSAHMVVNISKLS